MRSLEKRTGWRDQFARRVQLDLMQTKMAHEQVGRGNFKRIARGPVATVFYGITAILLTRRVGTSVGASIRENARRFQRAVLSRRQPSGQQQQTEEWEQTAHWRGRLAVFDLGSSKTSKRGGIGGYDSRRRASLHLWEGLACPPPIVTRLSRSCSFVASTLTADSEWRLFGQVRLWPFRGRLPGP